jgi:Aerotolerance regulator N-terminal/von Willebrand factor type A domain
LINQWVNPWMLVALVAMAIPLIIEWLLRRRRRRIDFPAMRYLMNRRKRRRVQLQDLILLLVRTVVPALVVIAIARPMWRPQPTSGAAAGDGDAARHAVIVLDATYSMGQSIGQTTAFAVAQAMGQDVLRGLAPDQPVSLVVLGDRPAVVSERSADHDGVFDAIARAQVSDMAGRMPDAVEAVNRLIDATPSSAEVYLVSDLQRSTWGASPTDPRDAAELAAKLAQRAEVFVLDTGGENRFNAYVTRFAPQDRVLAVGMDTALAVEVEVRNMPSDGRLWLTLFADEDRAPTPTPTPGSTVEGATATATDAAPAANAKPGKIATRELTADDLRGGRAVVTFHHAFAEPGEHLLRVELEGDGLAIDNQRLYLASVPQNVDVLVVDPRHGDDPTTDGAINGDALASGSAPLTHAIAPAAPPGFDRLSPFAVTVRRPDQVLQLSLDSYAVVVLTNVGRLTDAFVSRLEQYVSDGGRLLIFVGEGVTPYEYNTLLYKGGRGLLPCELVEPVGLTPAQARQAAAQDPAKADAVLFSLAYAEGGAAPHPAVADVRHFTRRPAPPSISRYMRLKLRQSADDAALPVAFYSNHEPAICTRPFGQGRVMLVGTSADASWNYLAYTGEYLVLVQELMRWLVGAPDDAVNLQIGQPFQQPVLLSSQYLLLRRPDYTKVRLAPTPQGDVWRVAYDGTDRQGLYEIDAGPEFVPRRRFVVNMATSEGDLARLDAAALDETLAASGAHVWGPATAIERNVEARHAVHEYAWLVLWALLAMLAVETLLATRFGRRRI